MDIQGFEMDILLIREEKHLLIMDMFITCLQIRARHKVGKKYRLLYLHVLSPPFCFLSIQSNSIDVGLPCQF